MQRVSFSIHDLLQELSTLNDGPWSFERWEQFLAAQKAHGISTLMAPTLWRRAEWLADSRKKGLTPEQAELEFNRKVDIDREFMRAKDYSSGYSKTTPSRKKPVGGDV